MVIVKNKDLAHRSRFEGAFLTLIHIYARTNLLGHPFFRYLFKQGHSLVTTAESTLTYNGCVVAA